MLNVCWWIVLGLLAARTANPVTVNRTQILKARYVVTAKVIDASSQGKITVLKEWKANAINGTIAVSGLPAAGAKAGSMYVIPLSRGPDGLLVSATPVSGGLPQIYPASIDSALQLRSILDIK